MTFTEAANKHLDDTLDTLDRLHTEAEQDRLAGLHQTSTPYVLLQDQARLIGKVIETLSAHFATGKALLNIASPEVKP